MKKPILLSLVLFQLNFISFGQTKYETKEAKESIPEAMFRVGPNHQSVSTASGQVSLWYNYGQEMDTDSGWTQSGYYRNYLFPDSTVKANFSGGIGSVWKHSFGQVLDPTSVYFDFPLGSDISYTIDTIGIWYKYYRFQNTVDDTIVCQFFDNSKITFNSWNANSSDPDTNYAYVGYNKATRKGTNPTVETAVPINSNDTVSGSFVKFLSVPVGVTVPAGQKIAAAFTYFPGNAYGVGDTIDPTFNATHPINSFVVYNYKDSMKLLEEGKNNNEMVATSAVRYNTSTNGWNGKYIPGTSWNSGFYHLNMEFKITTLNLSIGQVNGSLVAASLFPSPLNKNSITSLKVYLQRQQNVHWEVFSLDGKTIAESESQNLSTGLNTIQLTNSFRASGLYLIKITGDDFSVVRKFVVN